MSIFNRRNAVLGWTVWQVGKLAAKRKARDAIVPSVDRETKRPNASAIAAAAAAVGGALLFWRRRRSGEPEPADE